MDIDKRWVVGICVVLLLVFGAGVKYSDFKHERQAEEIILTSPDLVQTEDEPEVAEEKYIEVYVTGAVKHPGVYRLREGDRMHQAVELAGGLREDADARYLEMARLLTDGETIPVPLQGEVAEAQAAAGLSPISPGSLASPAGSGKININTASAQQMADSLDGIGPALGQRIVDYRNSNGAFKEIEEITNVSGIGEKRFEAIKDKISVR